MKKCFYLVVFTFLLSANVYSQEKFTIQKPPDYKNFLDDVFFTNSSNGIAVGQVGIILITTDGGNTWSRQTNGSTKTLSGVSFANTNDGIAVGEDGIILKTNNGGKAWTALPAVTSSWLSDVTLTKENFGYIVGEHGIILQTSDRGRTWKPQTSGTTYILRSVSFTNASYGIVVGDNGTILRTTNGGTTWIQQPSGTTKFFTGISFADLNNGIAVGGSYDDFGNPNGIILKTTDGGASWITQLDGASAILTNISFTDVNNATVVGSGGTIYRTTNGGNTWELQSSGTSKSLSGVFFTSKDSGIIIGDLGLIFKTTNGGINWIPKAGTAPNLSLPENNASDIDLKTLFMWQYDAIITRSYEFQLSKDSIFNHLIYQTVTQNNSLEVSQLVDSTLYFWRVRLIINNEYGVWSDTWSFRTLGKTPRLINPINNVLLNSNTISLQWSNAYGSSEYRLQISLDSLFQINTIDTDRITSNSFVLNVNYNTKYYWRIGARNIDNQIYWSSIWSFSTIPEPKHSFSLDIGNKWYYQAGSNDHSYFYGCIKEVTGASDYGFKEITSKYYYHDSISIKKEYWADQDGKFYINSTPVINPPAYDGPLIKDTCIGSLHYPECWSHVLYNIFSKSDTAQEHDISYVGAGGTIYDFTVIFPEIGLVKTMHYDKNLYFSVAQEDSMYLTGIYRNGELLGDTIFNIPPRDTIYIPLNIGQKWIYNLTGPSGSTTETREVTNILDDGSREMTVSYSYNNNLTVKKEYWLLENKRLYISETPGVKSYIPYYDAGLGYLLFDNQSAMYLYWSAKYTYKNKKYDCQYRSELFTNNYYSYAANLLGPVIIQTPTTSETLIDMLTGIDTSTRIETNIPKEFALYQNYPNPFNPTTAIRYEIPKPGFVTLKVYDMLGREVTTLVNEQKQAGSYEVEFSGGNLSSGVYIYKLQAGSYTAAKKLLLLK